MKSIVWWIFAWIGPALAIIGMKRNRVPWNSKTGLVALIAAAVVVLVGMFFVAR